MAFNEYVREIEERVDVGIVEKDMGVNETKYCWEGELLNKNQLSCARE